MSYKFCPHCGKPFIEMEAPRSVPFITQTTGSITWADVLEWSHNNEASKHFEIGDEIHETLKTGEEVVFVVVAKDIYREGEAIFGLKDCLAESYPMNETSTNAGGWNASALRRVLNSEILDQLPDDLRACIKPRRIDGEESALWLFSEREIFGDNDWTENDPDCGVQLPYFKWPVNRVKGLGKDGSAYSWWERSPYASYTDAFCIVYSNGYAHNSGASYSSGVAFGFCV